MTDEETSALARAVQKGRQDGVWFIENVLGETLWEDQKEIASSVLDARNSRTAVRSCHSSGKTFLAARIALAFSMMYPKSRVISTAPTFNQVSRLLWTEIRAACAKLPELGATINNTELIWSPDHFMVGLSTDDADRFVGHHADHILVLLDEGPGVRPEIWEATIGLLAGGDARMLVIGNPTEASGPFHDCFHSQSDRWNTFHIDAMKTPNLRDIGELSDEAMVEHLLGLTDEELDDNPFPYLTTKRFVLEAAQTFGVGSGPWLSRVKGDFPTEGSSTLVSLPWIEKAIERYENEEETNAWLKTLEPDHNAHSLFDKHDWQIGIDVAGPGSDETVVAVRQGRRIVRIESWAKSDPRGEVLSVLDEYRKYGPVVCVDAVGIGYYMARHLKDAGFKVVEVNVGKAAHDKRRFKNLRAELHWNIREQLEKGQLDLPRNAKLQAQSSSVKYEYTPQGQVKIESKQEAQKRGVKSPDIFESVMLAAAQSNAIRVGKKALRSEILI